MCRSAFGIRGANVATVARGLVGTGWFGIQTAYGGKALAIVVRAFASSGSAAAVNERAWRTIEWLGLSAPELACYLAFLAAQLCVIYNGIESIRRVEEYAAPLLIALTLALFVWAMRAAGGFGPMLSAPSAFAVGGAREGESFLRAFFQWSPPPWDFGRRSR